MSLDYQSIIAVFAAIAKFFWWLGDVFLKAISAVADSGYLEAIIVFLVMAIIVLFCKVGKNNFAGIAAKKKKAGDHWHRHSRQ